MFMTIREYLFTKGREEYNMNKNTHLMNILLSEKKKKTSAFMNNRMPV